MIYGLALLLVGCGVVSEPTDGETIALQLGQTFEFGALEVELGREPGFFSEEDLYAFYLPVTITNTSEDEERIWLWENTFYYGPTNRFIGSIGQEFIDDIAQLDSIEADTSVDAKIHIRYVGPGEYSIRFIVRDDASNFESPSEYNGIFELLVEFRDTD